MLCLAWTVGGTEGKKGCQRGLENLKGFGGLGKRHFRGTPSQRVTDLGSCRALV